MTDWQVGDLALCVNGEGWVGGEADGPAIGEIRAVEGVRQGLYCGRYTLGLALQGYDEIEDGHRVHYLATCFRKIRPSAVEEVNRLRALLDRELTEKEAQEIRIPERFRPPAVPA